MGLVLSQVVVCQQGYTFPDKYQASGRYQVADVATKFEWVNGLAYIFTDYSYQGGAQRVDEVWNITSTHGTFLGGLDIEADSHLFFLSGQSYYFYSNQNGTHCSVSQGGLLPQNTFGSSSAYVGEQTYYGIPAYVYSVPLIPKAQSNMTLYVSKATERPLGLVVGTIPGLLEGTSLDYYSFEVVNEFSSSIPYFQPPEGCIDNEGLPNLHTSFSNHLS